MTQHICGNKTRLCLFPVPASIFFVIHYLIQQTVPLVRACRKILGRVMHSFILLSSAGPIMLDANNNRSSGDD